VGVATTVKASWESFEEAVMPPDAGRVQRQEMRRAFYAGAWAVLCTVREVGEESVSEADGVATLEAIKAELQAFQFLITKGRA
jgi:hypothetical protein